MAQDGAMGIGVIEHQGVQLKSAYCEICKSKIFPTSMLADHVKRHQEKRRYVTEKWLKPLRQALKVSRL